MDGKGAAKSSIGSLYEYVKEYEPEFLKLFSDTSFKCEESYNISDIYRFYNSKEHIENTHKNYINIARIGIDDEYKGMDWLTWWYQRNLIIFSRLPQLINSNDERILLLIGSGHIGILSNFLEESGLFEVVDTLDYL